MHVCAKLSDEVVFWCTVAFKAAWSSHGCLTRSLVSNISRCICHSRLLPRSIITTAAKRPLIHRYQLFYRTTHMQRTCIAQYILRTVCSPQASILSKRLNINITKSIRCQRRVVARTVKFLPRDPFYCHE